MESAINGYYKLSWRERIEFCSGDLLAGTDMHKASPYDHPKKRVGTLPVTF